MSVADLRLETQVLLLVVCAYRKGMGQVTKTELNQQTARVLARVAAGEKLTVTDRGRPIAQLSPPEKDVWAELIASGRVTLPTASGALTTPAAHTTQSTWQILDDLRSDRL